MAASRPESSFPSRVAKIILSHRLEILSRCWLSIAHVPTKGLNSAIHTLKHVTRELPGFAKIPIAILSHNRRVAPTSRSLPKKRYVMSENKRLAPGFALRVFLYRPLGRW